MALSMEDIASKVESLRQQYNSRDARMSDITAVRRGDMESVYPDMFPEGMSRPMIANFVDVAARDISEVLAPLPSFNCHTANTTSDKSKKAADTRTMIVNNIVEFSGLQTQMYTGADWYVTYAFLPFVVEPDFEARMPRIRVESPMGAYPEFDRYGRVVSYTKRYLKTVAQLIIEFPEFESQILGPLGRQNQDLNAQLDFVRYEDKDQIVLFLPQRGNLPLHRTVNPFGKVSVKIARRPGLDMDDPRGQFDDVLWAQIARARFSLLAMDAAEKSVNAPMVVPQDVQEFAFGPDAVMRTANPAGVRRVALEIPSGAFQEQQILENEMRMGARYPEGRSGVSNANIITGSGIEALMGGFDTQIKSGQQILAEVLQEVIGLALEMDEMVFPGPKLVNGVYQGAPYTLTYDPIKDIAGDYTVLVRYGLMSGLDPSRALIFSLQALNAGLISRDFVMQELPWSVNVSKERERIDIEKMRDALTGSLNALAGAIPQMASQGQDPSEVISKLAMVIEARRKGVEIENAVTDIFAPPPPPEPTPQAPAMNPLEMLAAQGGAPQPAPGQAAPVEAQGPMGSAPVETAPGAPPSGQAPSGNPDIRSILAQLGG
jgi:hypothetical protein